MSNIFILSQNDLKEILKEIDEELDIYERNCGCKYLDRDIARELAANKVLLRKGITDRSIRRNIIDGLEFI